jgi:hypothetical protein
MAPLPLENGLLIRRTQKVCGLDHEVNVFDTHDRGQFIGLASCE